MQHVEIKIELYLIIVVAVGVASFNQNVLQASFFCTENVQAGWIVWPFERLNSVRMRVVKAAQAHQNGARSMCRSR